MNESNVGSVGSTLSKPRNALLTEKKAIFERARINGEALPHVPAIAKRLLPNGRVKGRYWQAHLFSKSEAAMNLSVDLVDGSWHDFHNGKRGSDVQSLIMYIAKLDVLGAHLALKQMLGLE